MMTQLNRTSSTTYDGPVVTASVPVGGRTIRLVRPAEPDRLLDDPHVSAWNRCDDYMPYWAYLWPGAYLLAEAVAREPWREGTAALEIGCGLGLGGLVALSQGLRVQFSDYDEAALDFVTRSAQENGFDPARFSTRRLDWRNPPCERFSVILGADVLYERRLVPLVADLLANLLEPDGFALIAGPYRGASEGLACALAARNLEGEAEPIRAVGEYGPVNGTLCRIRHAVALA
jgi:predicted nicotinamide N-methyase